MTNSKTLVHQSEPAFRLDYDKNKEWPILISLFFLGLAFRLPNLTACSLWLDEAWRVARAVAPFSTAPGNYLFTINQIVSYDGLLRLMVSLFGYSETAVRIPSALAGALAVPMSYRMGRFLFEKNLAILAALLICLSPLHITYSQEAVGYTIGSLATLVFYINIIKLSAEIKSWNIASIIVSALVMVLAHTYLLLLATTVLCVYAFSTDDKRFRYTTIACALIILILSIPSVLSLLVFSVSGHLRGWKIDAWMMSYPIRIINAFISGPFRDTYTPIPVGIISKIVASFTLLAVILLAPVAVFKLTKENKNVGIWLISIGTYLIFLIFQTFLTNTAEVRYIVPVLPILFILLVSIAKYLPGKLNNVVGYPVLLMLLISFVVVINEDSPGLKWKPDARAVATQVRGLCEKTQGVALISPEVFELPIYKFYLDKTNCKIIHQPAFEEYFYRDNRKLLYRTSSQLQEENDWFVKYLRENNGSISTVYIVSERAKDRASQIADVMSSSFKRVTKSESSKILVIKLEK